MDQCAQEEGEDGRRGVPTEAGPQDASPKPGNSPQTDTGAVDDSIDRHAAGQSSVNGCQSVELKEASGEEQSDPEPRAEEGDVAPSKETDAAEPMDVGVCEGSGAAGSDSCVPPMQPTHNGTTLKTDEDSHTGLFASTIYLG